MTTARTDDEGFLYEWVTTLDGHHLVQIRRLFNAVLETETVIGFPAPLENGESQGFFDELAQDVRLRRKDLLLVRAPNESVVAMLLLSQNAQPNCRHIAELSKCIIQPEYRGQGVLDGGVKALAERCREIGVDVLTMDVRKGSRAEKIWRLLGFTPFGELPDYARVAGKVEAGVYMWARADGLGRTP